MASQFARVRGKKPRYDYTSAINAQGQYLPAQIAARKSKELDEKGFALEEEKASAYKQHLTSMDEFNQANLDFMEKQAKQAKKDSRVANILGIGKLGTDVYFAHKASKTAPILGGVTAGSPAEAAEKVSMGGDSASLAFAQAQQAKKSPGFISSAKDFLAPNQSAKSLFSTGALSRFGGAVNPQNIATGGGAGVLASNLLTDEDDKWWKKAGVGALAGAGASYLGTGGDLFSTAVGGAFGGGAGLFDFNF